MHSGVDALEQVFTVLAGVATGMIHKVMVAEGRSIQAEIPPEVHISRCKVQMDRDME